ncbi:unnamed protein product [Lepeophtheirus salmonis]|uniref:(salmon louse) hypothetical protein n=1 Tax=Lepeophtheirus salmonis TaxID=72036 RepID=A0A7R8CQG9_LEPSM|nr:unnamed protein product [Lepeophtheirus salmonis]CAF2895228.1 unnamed protein product [Lepeophtheirus salmonis]
MASHLPGSSSSSSSNCSSRSGRIMSFEKCNDVLKKYPIKTLCFNKKLLSMPSKDEYSILLCNGLGARKWVVSFKLDAESFKRDILKIYPLLSTVSGFTLWTINKDKEFEKLPPKVNTPKRISAYFGTHFSGCLIIMPSESIPLISSETLHPEILYSESQPEITISDTINISQINASDTNRNKKLYRQCCCLCGKTSKSFDEGTSGSIPISASIKSILNIDLNKMNHESTESICKKCYHQLLDIDYLQFQLQSKKEEILANFFHTMTKPIKSVQSTSLPRQSWTKFLSNEGYNSSVSINGSDANEVPNSSPSPQSSRSGGSSDSSSSSTTSFRTNHRSWKKRYCEMTQVTSFLNVNEKESHPTKKKKMNLGNSTGSDEDSGVMSSGPYMAIESIKYQSN